MKCPHCGTEWTIQKTTSQTVFCPGCGKPCRAAPEKQEKMESLEDFLCYLFQKFGEETFQNGEWLIGCHTDLMPQRERDRRLLRILVGCDGHIALLEAKKKPEWEQSVAIARLVQKMQTEKMFAPAPVREVCTAFWLGIGGSREALKSILPQSAPAPKPAPKPASRPIPQNAVCRPSDYEIVGRVLKKYKGQDKIIRIPDGVTVIDDHAFLVISLFKSSTIEEVWLPDGVKRIGFNAFSGCKKLKKVSLPDGLQTIGNFAFNGCESLASITLPVGLQTIGKWAFAWCESLASITLPDGLQTIGEEAFSWCHSLASITLPDGLQTIKKNTFYHSYSIKSIDLPVGFQTIEERAFRDCYRLRTITIPDSVARIDSKAFEGCHDITVIASDAWKKAHPDLLARIPQ